MKEVRNNIISLPGQKAPRTRRRREKAEDRGKKQEGRLTNYKQYYGVRND